MTIGPVQLLVIGFADPDFHGQIRAELDRLRESDTIRLLDLAVVRKDADGNIEHLQASDLSTEEAEQFGAMVGALIGLGAALLAWDPPAVTMRSQISLRLRSQEVVNG